MKLLILGATGGTGRALVAQALAQGHVVTAFARNPAKLNTTHPNLRVAQGDILNYDSIEAAVVGQDAVLSALGSSVRWQIIVVAALLAQLFVRVTTLSRAFSDLIQIGAPLLAALIVSGKNSMLSEGTRNIVQALNKLGVRRFVCESSLGVGDSKGQLGFLYNFILIPLLLRGIFADKEIQEAIIQGSKLDWVIVRPAALTNGALTGTYRSGFSATENIRCKISRADVAEFMLKQLTSNEFVGKCPGLSY